MRKTKRLVMFALTLLCLSGVVSTPVNAQVISDVHVHVTYEDPSGAEFTGDPFYTFVSIILLKEYRQEGFLTAIR